jgi:2-polyprenyl-3-methyl-5-hydroxy-6-metoxy-1,4-benzoquinol methylase
VSVNSMSESNTRAPYLKENLWGYGKRLRFVDAAIKCAFPVRERCDLTILDLGCGNGSQLAIPLAAAGYRVTGVDPHLPSIERGRNLAPAITFIHGPLSELPPRKFDCVVISEVLEHLDSPEIFVALALPYLAESGILIITVPNGYGEFELDLRLYRALRADKMVAWLYRLSGRNMGREYIASSDDETPHVQRFTLSRLRKMFDPNNLFLLEARGTSIASGPFVLHLLGRFDTFVRLNAAVADHVPLSLASGWMFVLRKDLREPQGAQQIPPLRCAPVGMTKGREDASRESSC